MQNNKQQEGGKTFFHTTVCVCVHIQVHLNKLECRGQVHLFQ